MEDEIKFYRGVIYKAKTAEKYLIPDSPIKSEELKGHLVDIVKGQADRAVCSACVMLRENAPKVFREATAEEKRYVKKLLSQSLVAVSGAMSSIIMFGANK